MPVPYTHLKEDMRLIEDTKKWVLSPERKAPQATREYAAHRLDTVLDKFLKTMQITATCLQEKLLRPDVRQKCKEQVKDCLLYTSENAATEDEWRKYATHAVQSTYGYEYQGDNLLWACAASGLADALHRSAAG